jgi:hypothetical protein
VERHPGVVVDGPLREAVLGMAIEVLALHGGGAIGVSQRVGRRRRRPSSRASRVLVADCQRRPGPGLPQPRDHRVGHAPTTTKAMLRASSTNLNVSLTNSTPCSPTTTHTASRPTPRVTRLDAHRNDRRTAGQHRTRLRLIHALVGCISVRRCVVGTHSGLHSRRSQHGGLHHPPVLGQWRTRVIGVSVWLRCDAAR